MVRMLPWSANVWGPYNIEKLRCTLTRLSLHIYIAPFLYSYSISSVFLSPPITHVRIIDAVRRLPDHGAEHNEDGLEYSTTFIEAVNCYGPRGNHGMSVSSCTVRFPLDVGA
jgi:hypothetical protein